MTSPHEIVEGLKGDWSAARQSGMARCPAHDDSTASLSVQTSRTSGKPLLKCFAGCTNNEVIAALRPLGLWHEPAPEGQFRAKPGNPRPGRSRRRKAARG